MFTKKNPGGFINDETVQELTRMADASAAHLHSGLNTLMTGYYDAFLSADTYWRFWMCKCCPRVRRGVSVSVVESRGREVQRYCIVLRCRDYYLG